MRCEGPRVRARGGAGGVPVRAALLLLAVAAAGLAGWALGLATAQRARSPAGVAAGHGERAATGGALQDLGPAPSWTLTDQNGRTVSSDSLRGKVLVVTFLFPYCRTYCPLIAAHLRGFDSTLRSSGLADRVRFVAFDVDPGHTRPADLRTFLRQYGWDPAGHRFLFVTGSEAEIRRVVRDGFHVDYRRVQASEEGRGNASAGPDTLSSPQPEVENPLADSAAVTYDVVHNDALELVGPDGKIRRYYGEADRISDERLLEDIGALLGRTEPGGDG